MNRVSPTPNPQPRTPSVLVIGIGSPFGDDAAGLEVARRLESVALPPGTRIVAADRPGVDLLDMFDGTESVILIDAVRSGGHAGEIHDLDLAEVPGFAAKFVSSHGLGVGEAIDLARRLGRLPARGRLLGIEVTGHGKAIEQPLADPISTALDCVIQLAEKWANLYAMVPVDFRPL